MSATQFWVAFALRRSVALTLRRYQACRGLVWANGGSIRYCTRVSAPSASTVAAVGLSVILAATPWAYGGIEPAHECLWGLVAWFTLATCGVVLVWRGPRADRGGASWVLFPLLLTLPLGVAQLLPMGEHLEILSPQAARTWERAAEVGRLAAGHAEPPASTISLYPASTRRDLARLSLPIACFLLASMAMTERKHQILVCGFVAVNGAAVALFGIVQRLTWNGGIYWTGSISPGATPFAAFVNRNHAGGYLNLCLAASLAWLLWVFSRNRDAHDPEDIARAYAWGTVWSRWKFGLVTNLNASVLCGVALATSVAAGVICSLSRGAMLALGVTCLGVAVVSVRRRGTGPIAVLALSIMTVGMGMALWLGQGILLRERLVETASDVERVSNSRIDHWQDALSVAHDYLLTGTGLGSYRFAYRPYESQAYGGWFYHAENQYLEALVEGGAFGLLLLAAAIGFAVVRAYRLLAVSHDDRVAVAIGVCGLFALGTQVVHAAFDFGLYLPANAILCAVLIGLSCAQIPFGGLTDNLWVRVVHWPARSAHAGAIVLVFLWLSWANVEFLKQARIDALLQWEMPKGPTATAEGVGEALARFANVDLAGDAEAHYRRAEWRVAAYRVAATEVLRRTRPEVTTERVWPLTAPVLLHRRAHDLFPEDPEQFHKLRAQPCIQEHLPVAVDDLVRAIQACPVASKNFVALAELSLASPDIWPHESQLLETAVALSPFDPEVLFRCGLLELQSGRPLVGFDRWKRCLTLTSKYAEPIARMGLSLADSEELFSHAIPDIPDRILLMAAYAVAPADRQQLADLAEASLSRAICSEADQKYWQAQINDLRGNVEGALDAFRQSITLEPYNVDRRFQLAQYLLIHGRPQEAREHAAWCLRAEPRSERHRELMRRIRGLVQRDST